MTFVLALITAVAALAAYSVPLSYLEKGWKRSAAQVGAILFALGLGSFVAGPAARVGGLTFSQMVLACILGLGLAMRLVLRNKK